MLPVTSALEYTFTEVFLNIAGYQHSTHKVDLIKGLIIDAHLYGSFDPPSPSLTVQCTWDKLSIT